MAILALPLVISVLKPQTTRLFLFCSSATVVGRPNCNRFFLNRPRHLTKTTASAISTDSSIQQHSSTNTYNEPQKTSVPTFQQAIQRLQEYWASVGCAVMQCSNTEVGAGTMNPLHSKSSWYVEPSIRPDDSRYGENPNRLRRHTQFQVILKPDPGNSQDLFIRSLSALGVDVNAHDIRFVEDNWESPVLGAWVWAGKSGWMGWRSLNLLTFSRLEVFNCHPYLLKSLMALSASLCCFRELTILRKFDMLMALHMGSSWKMRRSPSLLAAGLPIPAYDQLLKTSHAFNILDSRGFVGVTERARYFGRMRSLARQCAQLWLKTRESLSSGYCF
ncbi:glycine-tRNA ligase [Salix suchowensis]|nr:glycine-tRNA ligase [Salix suchowensis]